MFLIRFTGHRFLLGHVVLGLALFAAGCGDSKPAANPSAGTATTASPGTSKGKIGVSVMTTTNPFFLVIADNITAEAKKHGYEVVVFNGEHDVAKQQNQVKDMIVAKYAAIVLCPCDARSIGAAIEEANAAGIPVFTADTACIATNAKVVSHIASDNLGGGRLAAKAMIEALGEAGGKVAIFDFKKAESCLLRVQGFKEVVEKHNAEHPNSKISIVAELPSEGDKAQGYKCTEDVLQSHPDLAGIFAINDPSALGAREALEKAGKADQVTIVGFDGQDDAKQAIDAGKIYADPIQFPDRIGQMTMASIVRYFDGESVPPQQLIPTSLYMKGGLRGE